MMGRIALCADEMTCRNPETIGLDGESLEAQEWLVVFCSGEEARRVVAQDQGIEEAWVVSTEDVEPINLAATLKSDRPELCVRLVEFEGCGSLFSRANTALIDEVADRGTFVRRYAEAKARLSQVVAVAMQAGSADAATTVDGTVAAAAPRDMPDATLRDGSPEENPAEDSGLRRLAFGLAPDDALPVPVGEPLARVKVAGHAFVLPVVSGSGGAGKSSVSVVGAFIAQRMGYRTLLLDYDLQFGDAAIMAGVPNGLSIDVAMTHPDQLQSGLNIENGPAVLAAPSRLELAESVVRGMPALLEMLSGSFDVIIANTGAAWAEQHAVLLERSSAALFLVDQRASSVRACKHALQLCARCGIASGPFQFAVNRCAKNVPLTSADVSCALQGASVFELREGGRDVEDYLSSGAAADLLDSGNEFCASLQLVMARLLPGGADRAGVQKATTEETRPRSRRARHAGRKRKWGSA